MQNEGINFTKWIAKRVVLQIVIDDLRVPMWGTIVGETAQAVRVQVDDFFIEIEKSTIQAVAEVDTRGSS
jgi:hypothetical protein